MFLNVGTGNVGTGKRERLDELLDSREGTAPMSNKPVVVESDGGEVIASGESFSVRLKIALDEVVVTEQRLKPSAGGPPLHVHQRHTDAFYVLSGRLAVQLNQEVVSLSPGAMVSVPRGLPHTFFNPDSEPCSFLNIHAPGMGFDHYLLEINAALDAGADDSELTRIEERYDTYLVDPA